MSLLLLFPPPLPPHRRLQQSYVPRFSEFSLGKCVEQGWASGVTPSPPPPLLLQPLLPVALAELTDAAELSLLLLLGPEQGWGGW